MQAVRLSLRNRIQAMAGNNRRGSAYTTRVTLEYLHEMLDPLNAGMTIDTYFATHAIPTELPVDD